MSDDDDSDGFTLNAFVGEREPIFRLAESLPGAKTLSIGEGIYMIPFTSQVRRAAQIRGHDPRIHPEWPFRTLDPEDAQRCAQVAGSGRIAYVEAFGYKDEGYELGIAWVDGALQLGPIDLPWYSSTGGSIDQINSFLGVLPRFRRALLGKARLYRALEEQS